MFSFTRSTRLTAAVLMALLATVYTTALAATQPAHASLAGFKTVQSGYGWVQVDGDGRTDFCYLDSPRIRCMLVTPAAVVHHFSTAVDVGYERGRAWTDFNGDGKADYCRVVGGMSKMIQCTIGLGWSFGSTFTSGTLDPGYDAGRGWADANGDGRSDYCRIIGSWSKRVQCTLSTGDGFGASITSGILDPGWDAGRAWVDANGDRMADFCRVVNNAQAQCTLSTGNGFGNSFSSQPTDGGWDDSRQWADINADGKADFCRDTAIDADPTIRRGYVRCDVSLGTTFGASIRSAWMDTGGQWADVNGDQRDDYCRITGTRMARCTVMVRNAGGATAFGDTFSHLTQITGGLYHGWVDIDGDGKADHGVAPLGGAGNVILTLSTGFSWTESTSLPIPPVSWLGGTVPVSGP